MTAGWVSIPALLAPAEVDEIMRQSRALLASPLDQRAAGDKPAAGTRHLQELDVRSSAVASLLAAPSLIAAVESLLGPNHRLDQAAYRSPQPGFGGQRLHADDPPKLTPGPPTVATAIVALTDFTSENGATRLVPGSDHRPDLQRSAGSLEHHDDEIVLCGPAGTAFVFSGHLLHSGRRNDSEAERPALQLVWRTGS